MKTTDVRVRRAITAMAGGHAVVLTGDPNGDGYLVFAAQAATPRLVAFAVRHTSGYLRVALPGAECERL
ncbi:3,4-dihydroxy-2-butanone-4-phosphate synthase, partial [Mycobacterium tuberculosis]